MDRHLGQLLTKQPNLNHATFGRERNSNTAVYVFGCGVGNLRVDVVDVVGQHLETSLRGHCGGTARS